jgi:hypothetical protein
MSRYLGLRTLALCAIASFAVAFSGCTTVETRIQERPEAFQRMSPADQALVQQEKIRSGMSQDAVYIAWGPPSERAPGVNRGRPVETWIYYATASGDYYPSPFLYGSPYGFGTGFAFYGGHRGRLHRGFIYDPFYDPFFYNNVNIVRYPERTVSFENGRVISYQFLPAPRFF